VRVTSGMTASLVENSLQQVQQQLVQVQAQLASGHRINRPSDDPIGTENVLQWQNALAQNAQYQANAQNAATWLQGTQSALQSAISLADQVRSLAVSVGSGAVTAQQEQAIASEIGGLQSSLLNLANTQVAGQYIFSGQQTLVQPFSSGAGGIAYGGGTGTVLREVAPGEYVQANVDGQAAFAPVFQAIAAILYDLGSGGNPNNIAANPTQTGTNPYNPGPQGDLAQLDAAIAGLTSAEGQAGAQLQQTQNAQSQLTAAQTALQTLEGNTLNDNMAQSVVSLQQLQVDYQSALGAASAILQQSLASYLH
jgi:flagellar hook-associated protein 3 FlgL